MKKGAGPLPPVAKVFRIIWWSVFAMILVITAAALAVYTIAGDRYGAGIWSGETPLGYAVWIPVGLGILFSIAGARLGRSIFLPGWKMAERMADRARQKGRDTSRNPAVGIYIIALGLIETTALLGLFLYFRTGLFQAWIFMTGMSLLGWLVVKPEAVDPPKGDEN